MCRFALASRGRGLQRVFRYKWFGLRGCLRIARAFFPDALIRQGAYAAAVGLKNISLGETAEILDFSTLIVLNDQVFLAISV